MPSLFLLDAVALFISTVIAIALLLIVLGSGLEKSLNRSFVLLLLMEITWAVVSLLTRVALWLDRGSPLFLVEVAVVAFALMGPLLLMFTARYLDCPTDRFDLAALLGTVATAALSIPLFRHQFIYDIYLNDLGVTLLAFNRFGVAAAALPIVYFGWSSILFWRDRRHMGEIYLLLGVLILLAGFLVGGILNPSFPVMSLTTTLSFAALGYGVIRRQLFNPLRELNEQLESRVKARTLELEDAYREVEQAYAEVEKWVDERTAELQKEITERKRMEAERAVLLRALQHRSTQLRTAIEVSKSANMILDPESLIDQVVNLIQERFHFYYVGLFLLDEAGEYAVLRAGTGAAFEQMVAMGHKLLVGGPSMIGWCTGHAEARIAHDVGEEAIRFNNPLLPETRSEMALPLISRGRCIGALTVQSTEGNEFSQEDIAVLQTMADQVAIAIENARLLEAERRQGEELEALRQASLHVTSSLELQPVLEAIIDHALQLVSADNAHIFLYDGEALTFGSAAWAGGRQQEPFAVPRKNGLTYTVARLGKRIVVSDVNAHSLFQDRRWGGAVAGFPLRIGNRVSGVMNVAFETPHAFSDSELNVLELLADQAAIAIHNARMHQQVRAHAEELAVALARQEELDRLQGEFIQNVSHELRSPLALIRGYAEMLNSGEMGGVSSEQRHSISIIARRSQMLSELVEDITLILGAETRSPEWEMVALDEIAETAVADFQMAAAQAGLTLEAEIAHVAQTRGVLTYLRRVLDNLLSNAIKFTPAGEAIYVRVWQEGDHHVGLQVEDTGIGIPEGQLERIFERFYQVDGSARRRYGGVGLGLALVKELVELHGGQVEVTSKVDVGSAFTVRIPIGNYSG